MDPARVCSKGETELAYGISRLKGSGFDVLKCTTHLCPVNSVEALRDLGDQWKNDHVEFLASSKASFEIGIITCTTQQHTCE